MKRRRMLNALLAMIAVALFATAGARAADTASDACLTCHAGTAAPTIRQHASHAYGIDYAAAQQGGRKGLRPPAMVAAGLLVNGRVECTSCHVGHDTEAKERFRLRCEYRSLCIGCHDPKKL